jgi:hypothetical protein
MAVTLFNTIWAEVSFRVPHPLLKVKRSCARELRLYAAILALARPICTALPCRTHLRFARGDGGVDILVFSLWLIYLSALPETTEADDADVRNAANAAYH